MNVLLDAVDRHCVDVTDGLDCCCDVFPVPAELVEDHLEICAHILASQLRTFCSTEVREQLACRSNGQILSEEGQPGVPRVHQSGAMDEEDVRQMMTQILPTRDAAAIL